MDGDLRHGSSIIAYAHRDFDRIDAGSDTILPFMKGLPAETDFVVIGAGVAGLRAAIELAPAGRVLVLAKKESPLSPPAPGNTPSLSDENEIILPLKDTLISGYSICLPEAVNTLS